MIRKTTALLLALLLLLTACGRKASTWQELCDQGEKHLSEGRYEDAIQDYTDALELDSTQAAACAGRGAAYRAMGDSLAEEAGSASPLPEGAAGAYESALTDYLAAIGMDSSVGDWYRRCAEIDQALGRLEDAVNILNQGYEATRDEALGEEMRQLQMQLPPDGSAAVPDPGTQEQNPPAPVDTSTEAGLFTAWLSGGGWAQIVGGTDIYSRKYDITQNATEVASCLVDCDGDGLKELLISITYPEHEDGENFTAILDNQGGSVSILQSGNMKNTGGDRLLFKYDTQSQIHKLALEGAIDDGGFHNQSYLIVYDGAMTSEENEIITMSYSTDEQGMTMYGTDIEDLRTMAGLYEETDTSLTVWMINSEYASRADYEAVMNRYTDPVSPEFQLVPASADQPVPMS